MCTCMEHNNLNYIAPLGNFIVDLVHALAFPTGMAILCNKSKEFLFRKQCAEMQLASANKSAQNVN